MRELCRGRIKPGHEIQDYQISLITAEMQQVDELSVSSALVGEGIVTVAKSNSSHPLQNYLKGLRWDGEKRVDAWLITYLGAKPSNYVAAAGKRWLISAVARAMDAGCKADACLILEGKQGAGKSTALGVLGGQWFTDDVGEIENKDTLLQLRGKWIIELGELDQLSRRDVSQVKSFLTRRVDNYRDPYARVASDKPRQCVFAGTTNDQEIFTDDTGNRRFWPVTCGRIDIQGLISDRDQLWAEAVELYRSGAKWYLDTPELIREAEVHQEARMETDPWLSKVEEFCDVRTDVSIPEILREGIGKPEAQWTKQDKNRIGSCLTLLKFERYRSRESNSREYRYRRAA